MPKKVGTLFNRILTIFFHLLFYQTNDLVNELWHIFHVFFAHSPKIDTQIKMLFIIHLFTIIITNVLLKEHKQ